MARIWSAIQFGACVVLAFSMLAACMISLGHSNPGGSARDGSADPGAVVLSSSYAPHAPITIENNADFVSQGWPGDGSEATPYLIGGLEISDAGSRTGILIRNTTAYFVVVGCYIHGASETGILILNVTHGGLFDNICDSIPWYGIVVMDSGNITLDNNTCSHTKDGIYLVSTDSSALVNNTCSGLEKRGIYLSSSNDNTITNNTCTGNLGAGVADGGSGIVLESSSRNTLTKNVCNSGMCGILLSAFSHDCLLVDNFCSFGARSGMKILSSNNVTVQDNHATFNNPGIGTVQGISLVWSNNSRITSNICSSNQGDGISVSTSTGVVVSGNTCSNNVGFGSMSSSSPGDGIFIAASSSISVSDNICNSNSGHGIDLLSGINNTFNNNTCSFNYRYGGSLTHPAYGLNMQLCTNNLFSNCSFTSNDYSGAYIAGSAATRISNTTISSNGADGIVVVESSNTTVLDCELSSNANSDILLWQSVVVVLKNNEITGLGISMSGDSSQYWNSHDIDVSNTVNGKPIYYWTNRTGGTVPIGASQIILASSTGVVVELQDLRDVYAGIQLGFSSANEIRNNTLWGDLYGIYLYSSNTNSIHYNGIGGNSVIGLYVVSSSFNTIWNNAFFSNAVQADEDGGTDNYWNITEYGNYWSDWTSPDINMNGIVDNPYTLPSGSKDYYPLTTPPAGIPEFGSMMALVVVGMLLVLLAGFHLDRNRRK